MADPLSIVTGCVGLIATIGTATAQINGFVRTVREARTDLDSISRELTSLQSILDLIQTDASKSLPRPLTQHLPAIVENCNVTIGDLQRVLDKYKKHGRITGAKWAMSGKDDVESLKSRLETHTQSLSLALDTMTLFTAMDIKQDTAQIKDIKEDTSDLKQDTTKILEEIAQLRASLPPEFGKTKDDFILERYLEQLTTYTESALDSIETVKPVRHEQDKLENQGSLTQSLALPSRPRRERSTSPSGPRPVIDGNLGILKSSRPSSMHRDPVNPLGVAMPQVTSTPGPSHVTSHLALKPALADSETPHPTLHQSSADAQKYTGRSSSKRPGKSNPLFGGQYAVDILVSDNIQKLHHHLRSTPEVRYCRYSAVTCEPSQFVANNYLLRPSIYSSGRRPISILVSVFIGDTRTQTTTADTFNALAKMIDGLHAMRKVVTSFGEYPSKAIMLHLHFPAAPADRVTRTLEKLGVQPERKLRRIEAKEGHGKSVRVEKDFDLVEVSGKSVLWQLYEYTTQLRLEWKMAETSHSGRDSVSEHPKLLGSTDITPPRWVPHLPWSSALSLTEERNRRGNGGDVATSSHSYPATDSRRGHYKAQVDAGNAPVQTILTFPQGNRQTGEEDWRDWRQALKESLGAELVVLLDADSSHLSHARPKNLLMAWDKRQLIKSSYMHHINYGVMSGEIGIQNIESL
ncbi:hypothetical protein QBC43DRAFT_310056 [Cladorrhinum sp. PSN259]|nr:hypothetical protein QBC43DRAFT_310056 [Cladorrhinum sp. PSN259]